MNNNISQKITEFFEFFPDLLPLVRVLNKHEIKWLIGGSGCLFLYGNYRKPGDVDILLANSQHDEIDKILNIKSYIYTSELEFVRNSNPNNDHDLQLTSHLEITASGQKFVFDYGAETIQKKALKFEFEGEIIKIAPPEEALIVKAILQRGESVGKNDLVDIKQFLNIYPEIDRKYLQNRILELGASKRIGDIFT